MKANDFIKKIQYWASWLAYIAAIIAGVAAVIRETKNPEHENEKA